MIRHTPTRLADHDPTLVLIQLQMQQFADLGVAANADQYSVEAGQTLRYTSTVSNNGPAAAAQPAVALVFDAVVSPLMSGVPAGWNCGAPVVTTTTTVTCTIDTLAAGASATFTTEVVTDASLVGAPLKLAVAAQSQTSDPQPGNNSAEVQVEVTPAVVPAADLAVLLSITSSLKNRALPSKLVVFGEVGLAGEIRPAPRGQERLKEAAKLGFTRALIPEANRPKQPIPGMEIFAVRRVEEAVARIREIE